MKADALDFLGDTLTYGISIAVIGRSLTLRATAALAKGASLTLMGLWVLGSTAYQVLVLGAPRADVMGVIGALALAANAGSVLLLLRYKDGDANVRSVWLCSRNDAIGNVAVMLAAIGVWQTTTAWPDLIVAAIMAAVFLSSSMQILRQASRETGKATPRTVLAIDGTKRRSFVQYDRMWFGLAFERKVRTRTGRSSSVHDHSGHSHGGAVTSGRPHHLQWRSRDHGGPL